MGKISLRLWAPRKKILKPSVLKQTNKAQRLYMWPNLDWAVYIRNPLILGEVSLWQIHDWTWSVDRVTWSVVEKDFDAESELREARCDWLISDACPSAGLGGTWLPSVPHWLMHKNALNTGKSLDMYSSAQALGRSGEVNGRQWCSRGW